MKKLFAALAVAGAFASGPIANAQTQKPTIVLVHGAFAAAGLAGRFPVVRSGLLFAPPVTLSSGGADLYIRQDKFRDQFAADVSEVDAKLMAATQRPITDAALNESSGDPTWKTIPSLFVYGDKDKNIPPAAMGFMAARAQSKGTVVIKGASYVPMVPNPTAVAKVISRAPQKRSNWT